MLQQFTYWKLQGLRFIVKKNRDVACHNIWIKLWHKRYVIKLCSEYYIDNN